MKRSLAGKLILSAVMVLLATFALSFLPHAVRAEVSTALSASERSEAAIDELVERLMSAGDYIEGEAIVCYIPADNDELTT